MPYPPHIAWHYGATPPLDALDRLDILVVEPDHGIVPEEFGTGYGELFAYVAVGEMHPGRSYAGIMDDAWFIGHNAAWGSRIVDQAQPGWGGFLVERIVAPLWDKGYRGFFLDALDSYRLAVDNDGALRLQQDGVAANIAAIKARYPQARLILNRGFELLPQVHQHVTAIAAESLFAGYDAARGRYFEVPAGDREWLLRNLLAAKNKYLLPVYAIDYVPPDDGRRAHAIALEIAACGITPYVTDADLLTLGVGGCIDTFRSTSKTVFST